MPARSPAIPRSLCPPAPKCCLRAAGIALAAALSGWCAAGTAWAGEPTTVPATTRPALLLATVEAPLPAPLSPGELDPLVIQLRDTKADLALRRKAAAALLDKGSLQGMAALMARLDAGGDPVGQQAVAQAIAAASGAPDPAKYLAEPLLKFLTTAPEAAQPDAAAALSRYDDPSILGKVEDLARDGKASPEARRGAILSLGFHHTQRAAGVLVGLLNDKQSAVVRITAKQSLDQLTGLAVLNYEPEKWQRWWDQNKDLSANDFVDRLLKRQEEVRDALGLRIQELQGALVEAYRESYRTAAPTEQEGRLNRMLGDPKIDAMRLAAVQLAWERLATPGPSFIGSELRKSLRERLDDSIPAIRLRATQILSALDDKEAADKIAGVLAKGVERQPDLLAQYLAMMARLPRPAGVGPALDFLGDPTLHAEAAGALAAMADAKLLDAAQTQTARGLARSQTKDDPAPDPSLVAVLARVGDESDWKRIEGWLDSPKDLVRAAAASAWARSDRSLLPLAQRAADAVIQPILYEYAFKRGRDPKVFTLIVDNRPKQDALVDSWQKALLAMGGRTEPAAVLVADGRLKKGGEAATFRAEVLTRAIDPLLPPDATRPDVREPAALSDLLLARAAIRTELRANESDASLALDDYRRITDLKLPLSPEQQVRHALGTLAVQLTVPLALKDWPPPFDLGRKLVKTDGGPSIQQDLPVTVFSLFLDLGEKLLPANKARAGEVALYLHGLALPGLPAELQARLMALVDKSEAILPVEPVNSTQPATTQPATVSAPPAAMPPAPMPPTTRPAIAAH